MEFKISGKNLNCGVRQWNISILMMNKTSEQVTLSVSNLKVHENTDLLFKLL
jgi:hypothetical protein